MLSVKPFEHKVVGHKVTITPYAPQHSEHLIWYSLRIRRWSPQASLEYILTGEDLIGLRDWINSALIAEKGRSTRS